MLLGLNSFMDGFSFWSGEWGVVTSKGSYRSWKKIVKVWMMTMKEGIFAGHPSVALPPPSTLPHLPLPHLPLP